ncbi:MAG: M15 family metallopeptidase [Gemmatimonadales bacterium]
MADSVLVDVRLADSTIRVEARYAGTGNFTGQPLPGYEANRALLRREAAAALGRVQRRLRPEGVGLKVFDGYRPIRATRAMVEWTTRTGREDLLDEGYIAVRSRHNLGLAVDLTLVRLEGGSELAMGTPFDEFSPAAHTANATGAVLVNRQRLVAAMEAEGFRNYVQEWWHFSFEVAGDPLAFDVPIPP